MICHVDDLPRNQSQMINDVTEIRLAINRWAGRGNASFSSMRILTGYPHSTRTY
jgi:hypothetical protein